MKAILVLSVYSTPKVYWSPGSHVGVLLTSF